jgi:hypothetical protein
MKRARLLGVILALFALAACDNGSLPPGGTYQAFSGTVTDAATGRPVAGATVTVDTVLTQTTDAAGKFSFAQVPVGEVDYRVSASGYTAAVSEVTVAPDKPAAITVTLVRPAPR